jgi:hypothetical protein
MTGLPLTGELGDGLARIAEGLVGVQDDLREIARGIHPAILARGGLVPALKALARRCTVPVKLDVRTEPRLPERVEVAAYYVVAEALTNAAKQRTPRPYWWTPKRPTESFTFVYVTTASGVPTPSVAPAWLGCETASRPSAAPSPSRAPLVRAHPCTSSCR